MLKRTLTLCLLLTTIFSLHAQRERVHLDLDKYSARAGDTIWFKGTVFKGAGPSNRSTTIYVQLLSEKGTILTKAVFPVIHGLSIGQVILPDSLSTNNYYLVGLTRQQLNFDTTDFFSIPILIYNKDSPTLVYHKKQADSAAACTAGTIKGITWISSRIDRGLSVLLRVDSPSAPRQLHLLKTINADSALRCDLTLSNRVAERQLLLPIDSAREGEELLLYEDSTLIGRQWITVREAPADLKLSTKPLNTDPYGYNEWDIDLPDSATWFTSISVTDADRSIPDPHPIKHLNASYTNNLTIPETQVDTSFITFPGSAGNRAGKSMTDPFSSEIVLMGAQDTNYLFTKVLRLDPQGRFKIDSLFFFGKMDLYFQQNKSNYVDTRDIQLRLSGFTPPPVDIDAIKAGWKDDRTLISAADTIYTPAELERYNMAKIKTLQAAIVKGWKDARKELDAQYTSGPFSEPAVYAYDLRTDTSEYNRDICSYIDALGTRLYYDRIRDSIKDRMNHPVRIFIDEHEYDPRDLAMVRAFDFERLAYLKILESDFLSTKRADITKVPAGPTNIPSQNFTPPPSLSIFSQPTALNVCIYTRKGKDYRTMRGGMNKVTVKGYDPILKFNGDRVTCFWDTFQSGHHFTIRFNNSMAAKRFRLKLEGISYTGKTIHYERVIEEGQDGVAKLTEK